VDVSPVGSTSAVLSTSRRKVLLVHEAAGDRLDGVLQFRQGELGRHQLEHHGAVLELGAQPRDGGRQNAAVIEAHRLAEDRQLVAFQRSIAAVALRLLDQAGLVSIS
jgi:hypothetical protein